MWFDPAVVEAVRDVVPTWLGVLMVVLSYLGSVYLIAPAMIGAYWANRDLVAPWLGGVLGCYGLMSLTKSSHTGSRPTVDPPVEAADFPSWFVPWYEHAAHIPSTSFPSGHTMAATIIIGILVVDLPVSTLRRRTIAGIGAVGWVSFTRIGLGVHYLGDVVGGIAYGLGYLACFYLARRYVPRRTGARDATVGFAVGLVFGFLAVTLVGSRHAHIVFGSAVGGLLSWYAAPTLAPQMRGTVWEYLVPLFGVAVVVSTWFVTDLEIGTDQFIAVWSALFLATVVLVPWIAPTREVWSTAKRRSRRITG